MFNSGLNLTSDVEKRESNVRLNHSVLIIEELPSFRGGERTLHRSLRQDQREEKANSLGQTSRLESRKVATDFLQGVMAGGIKSRICLGWSQSFCP